MNSGPHLKNCTITYIALSTPYLLLNLGGATTLNKTQVCIQISYTYGELSTLIYPTPQFFLLNLNGGGGGHGCGEETHRVTRAGALIAYRPNIIIPEQWLPMKYEEVLHALLCMKGNHPLGARTAQRSRLVQCTLT